MLIVGGLFLNAIPLAFLLQSPKGSSKNLKQQNESDDVPSLNKIIQASNGGLDNRVLKTGFKVSTKYADGQQDKAQINDDTKFNEIECIKPKITCKDKNKEMTINDLNKTSKLKTATQCLTNFTKVIKTPSYVLYVIGLAITMQAQMTVVVYIQDIILDAGHTKSDATLAIFLLNGFGILGRLMVGFLYKMKCTPTFSVPIMASSFTAVSIIGLFFIPQLFLKMICASLIGFPNFRIFISSFCFYAF